MISIHALLAESDFAYGVMPVSDVLFLSTLSLRRATLSFYANYRDLTFLSTLSLRRATSEINTRGSKKIFLSTLSLRRATSCTSIGRPKRLYFYPRSPCGERQQTQSLKVAPHGISIHALLAESDNAKRENQSGHCISIHALLAESDSSIEEVSKYVVISIHALLAESDSRSPFAMSRLVRFLSTLSLRRAT